MDTKERKRLNPTALAMMQASVGRTLALAKVAHKSGGLRVLPRPPGVVASKPRTPRVKTISAHA